MKFPSFLSHCVLALGLAAAANAQEVKLNQPADGANQEAAAQAPKFTEAQLVEEFGWFMAKRVGLSELDLTAEEIQGLLRGVAAAAEGKDSPFELELIGPSMDEFMMRKQAAYVNKLKQQGEAESAAHFAKLKENKNVVETASGLRYEIQNAGTGPKPTPSDTVRVHYTGKLINGTVFDSSVERGEPVEFKLDEVIPGWTEGLQHLAKGGKMTLHIPSSLAYGEDGRPGIPPASTLIFDVELLEINPESAPDAPETPDAE